MTRRHDPPERARWKDLPSQPGAGPVQLQREGRFARDTGDPRWGTGGLRADELTYSTLGESRWPAGQYAPEPRPASASHGWRIVGPHAGVGPRGYRRSDERIREDICEQLARDGQVDPSDFEVSVEKGEVTLSGTVATRTQKRLAEDIADAVFGVTDVRNQLRIQQPEQG